MRKTPSPLLPGLIACVGLVSCTTTKHASQTDSFKIFADKPLSVETGRASWYGGRWIGRKTANGERYRAGDMTAAHKRLPFNTMVRVTNLRNGKSTIVRINNRGPYVRGRIIDLSIDAARRIDMVHSGVVPVKLEVLEPVAPRATVLAHVQNQNRPAAN